MSPDEPPELKSLEAQLAALRPRTDGLDRDRLMYLAGQASAGAEVSGRATARRRPWSSRGAGWFWPAATAAMTGVAAVLLVMLCIRPGPSNGPQTAQRDPDRNTEPDTAVRPETAASLVQPPAAAEDLAARRPPPTFRSSFAADGLLAAVFGPAGRLSSGSAEPAATVPYARLRDQVLAHGLDSWKDAPSQDGNNSRVAPAVSYRELLDSLLDGPATSPPSPRRPAKPAPRSSGVES